jgi:hypothetical protein
VIVAVVAVVVMKMTRDAVIHVVSMRHCIVTAAWAVQVTRLMPAAAMICGATFGVLPRHLDHVLVHMISVRVMKVTIVQIVYMAAVTHGVMSASRPMLMSMTGMDRGRASGHRNVSFPCPRSADTAVRLSAAWSIALRTNGNTCWSARP